VATVYIGLGSNLDHPRQQIKDALAELGTLENSELLTASSLYCSPPMGPADQPDYINAVARIATTLLPLQLLERCRASSRRTIEPISVTGENAPWIWICYSMMILRY